MIDWNTEEKRCKQCNSWMDLYSKYSRCDDCRNETEMEVEEALLNESH